MDDQVPEKMEKEQKFWERSVREGKGICGADRAEKA